jgi:hypothetical protein
MRKQENTNLLFACLRLFCHYFFARGKGAELHRQHPEAERNYNENYTHYKGNEFFHGRNPFT